MQENNKTNQRRPLNEETLVVNIMILKYKRIRCLFFWLGGDAHCILRLFAEGSLLAGLRRPYEC